MAMQDEYGFGPGHAPEAWPELSRMPKSIRLFAGLMLLVAGLCYLTLLGSIWNDTAFELEVIADGYRIMDVIELTQHSFQHLFWFFGIFTVSGMLFLFSSYPERLKKAVAVLIPMLIVADISSQWLIRVHVFFSYSLYASGLLLALTFLLLFTLIQSDLWRKKAPR